MKTITTIIASAALLTLFSAPGVYAHEGQGQSSTDPRTTSGKTETTAGPNMFNPQTVETIRGEVLKVEQRQGRGGMRRGVHLLVKTEMGTFPVRLGPEWFIKNHNVQFKPNDQVEIKGSRITVNGREAFIASQVKDQNQVLKLRDDNGRPLWAGQPGPGGSNPGLSMTGRSSNNQNMTERRQQWIEGHKKVIEGLKKMDAELQQKLDAMNQAQGPDKVNAMAAVINELAKQRETIDKQIEQFAQRGIARMERRQAMMGQGQNGQGGMGQGGTGNSTGTTSGQNHSDKECH